VIIQENIPLAPLTTLRIGGPARYFVEARSEADVFEALRFAKRESLPVFVLGSGSNLLVCDAGFEGVVVRVALEGLERSELANGEVHVTAAAGTNWDTFVKYCVDEGLAGIENLSGIPGLVGGTPVQNVGAYGQEVSDTIVSVRCIDRRSETVVEIDNSDCGFSYRTSIFNSTERDRHIVLAVRFRLTPNGDPDLSYKDLRSYFDGRQPGLIEVREAVIAIRRSKSMVIEEGDPNRMSAGSFFKNPVVSQKFLNDIKYHYSDVPSFPFGEAVKIPAAWLIEKAGFYKGFRLGNAGISTNHTLALINCGGATASEIIGLKDLIQDRVSRGFGLGLVPEPVFLGF